VIVSTLVFSELPPEVQQYTLGEAAGLLKPEGRLLIADEIIPEGLGARLAYWAVHLPLMILTWLLTRTTTTPLSDLPQALTKAGFIPSFVESQLG